MYKNIWQRRELINYDKIALHQFATHDQLSWWSDFNLVWYHHLPITRTFFKGTTYNFKFHISGVKLYREFGANNFNYILKKGFYLACEQSLQGSLVVGWEKEGELGTMSLEFEFHLQFSCGSDWAVRFLTISVKWNEHECKQTLKNKCQEYNDIININVISAQSAFRIVVFDADIQIAPLQDLVTWPFLSKNYRIQL